MSGDSSGRNQPRIKSSKRIFGRSRYPDNRALTLPARRNGPPGRCGFGTTERGKLRGANVSGVSSVGVSGKQSRLSPSMGDGSVSLFAFASRASRVNRPREAVEKWSTRTDGPRRRGGHPRVRCLVGSEHPASLEVAPDQGQQEVNFVKPGFESPGGGNMGHMTNNQSVPPEPVPPPEPPPGPDVPEADRARAEGHLSPAQPRLRLVDARPPVHADPLAWRLPPL